MQYELTLLLSREVYSNGAFVANWAYQKHFCLKILLIFSRGSKYGWKEQ